MTTDDRRLIEDYLPIQAISAEASREKSVRKGHISTLHLWWARRPLVACRAAVYGALVPTSRFVPENGSENKKQSLGRANAARFIEQLCKYPGNPTVIKEAQRHSLEAHAERLTRETGKEVTVEDIEEGRAPRPKVLDMFAGGGAIPLEALRLGCEAYALDLNPVAHIIELWALVYPQKYGKPDPTARGMTGPTNAKGETTWGGLADEVRPELERIVREHMDTLWKMGVTGGDLVIAAVGAGLRALTRFSRVEYHSGVEVPAEKFLDEARPDQERLRLVAQALAGTALAGKKDNGAEHTVATTAAEQAALKKLVANWRALIDQRLAADEGTLFDSRRGMQ